MSEVAEFLAHDEDFLDALKIGFLKKTTEKYVFETLEVVVDETLFLPVLSSNDTHEGEETVQLSQEEHLIGLELDAREGLLIEVPVLDVVARLGSENVVVSKFCSKTGRLRLLQLIPGSGQACS